MASLKQRRLTLEAAWQDLAVAARDFLTKVEAGLAFKSLDTIPAETSRDGLEFSLDAVIAARDELQNYSEVTVAGNRYNVVEPEIKINGTIYTAEQVAASQSLCDELVEGSSTMLRIQAPTSEFSADDLTADVDQDIDFTDESTNAPTEWRWDFGDGTNSILRNPTHAYAAPGTYTVELTVANAGGSNTKIRADYITVS